MAWLQILLTALVAVLASSGFWAYLQHKDTKRTQTDRLLQGLAYGQIVFQGMEYISRGWVTNDEYNDFRRYLYEPYRKLGGNGVTERIMAAVTDLPLRSREVYSQVIQSARTKGQEERDTANYLADAA